MENRKGIMRRKMDYLMCYQFTILIAQPNTININLVLIKRDYDHKTLRVLKHMLQLKNRHY